MTLPDIQEVARQSAVLTITLMIGMGLLALPIWIREKRHKKAQTKANWQLEKANNIPVSRDSGGVHRHVDLGDMNLDYSTPGSDD